MVTYLHYNELFCFINTHSIYTRSFGQTLLSAILTFLFCIHVLFIQYACPTYILFFRVFFLVPNATQQLGDGDEILTHTGITQWIILPTISSSVQDYTKHQPHNLKPRWCSHVGYGPFTTNYSWNIRSIEEHASYPQNDIFPEIVFFRIFKDNKSFWEMGRIEKRVGNIIHILKGPQFTHKRHLNQLRKRLTDSGSPEETVMDVIYDTFNILTSLAAQEMHRFKRRKATDSINQKRIRYWDQNK